MPSNDTKIPLVPGSDPAALDAGAGCLVIPWRKEYGEWPVTLEIWARVRRRDTLLARYETNDSAYSFRLMVGGVGEPMLFLPGRDPWIVVGKCDLRDGAWHHLAAVIERTRAMLYVDGRECGRVETEKPRSVVRCPAALLVGTSDDVAVPGLQNFEFETLRLSSCARALSAPPERVLTADAATIGLWRIGDLTPDRRIPDRSARKHDGGLETLSAESLDSKERRSYRPGPAPLDLPAETIELLPRSLAHPPAVTELSLDGDWQLAENGALLERLQEPWTDAIRAVVPGSVHTALAAAGAIPDPKFGLNDAVARGKSFQTWWFKREFRRPEGIGDARLTFDGVAVRCTAWLNGTLLGSHEGMFGGPEFSVGELLRDENTLIVRIDPAPFSQSFFGGDNAGWRKTVVFNNVYGWHYSDIPALGIWRGVRLRRVPAVRLQTPLVATRDAARGEISLRVDLAGEAVGWRGVLRGTIAPETFPGQTFSFLREVISAQAASALHLAMTIPDVRPWFPNGMGAPDLYRLTLSFARDDGAADNCETTFGVRTVTMAPLPGGVNPKTYDWTFVINGAPRFIKGSGWCTMDSSMDFSRPRYERFLELARRQHVQMLRAWGSGMPETDDFYDLCDRKGILVMQEWPTAWNSDRVQPFEMLEETVRLNTLRIRNHPSLAMYGGGNESGEPFSPAIDMMGRYAVELDGTRPFHRSEPWGGSDHNYGCWWGRQHLDFNLTMTSAFWGEFGIASMPVAESVRRYLPENEKNAWPAPADGSLIHHTPVFNRAQDMERLTQYAGYLTAAATMDDFIRGSQVAQAIALRHTLERARTRWPECTGALYYKMNDNYPAASWAVADWYGAVKIAHYFCRSAFAPLHAVALFDHLDCAGKRLELPVFLLDDSDDLRRADWQVRVRALDGKLAQFAEKRWDGRGAAGPVHRLGEFVLDERQTAAAPLFIVCDVEAGGKLADRGYYFVNFEAEKDSLFRLPRTTLAMKKRDGAVELTNTGTAPAVGAALERPGHADTFLADDNFLWLEPGEMRSVAVNTTEGLIAAAWNAATVR